MPKNCCTFGNVEFAIVNLQASKQRQVFCCHLVTLWRWSRLSYNMRKRKRLKQILWRWDRFSLKGDFSFLKHTPLIIQVPQLRIAVELHESSFYISQVQNSRHVNISAGSQQAPLPSMVFHSKGWTGGCFVVWFCSPWVWICGLMFMSRLPLLLLKDVASAILQDLVCST